MELVDLPGHTVFDFPTFTMSFSFLRIALFLLAVSAVNAAAVTRSLNIKAPATIQAGTGLHVEVSASTDATDAEQIGFFQAEYSLDNGKTWVPVYAEKVGRSATRAIDAQAGPAGSTIIVRARIAFRGGKAGDVDFAGTAIAWGASWGKWTSPPAKTVTIAVTAN